MSYADMTPREAVKLAEHGNVFPADFVKHWDIDTYTRNHSHPGDAVEHGKRWAKAMRGEGWTTKRHTNSLACYVTAVRRKPATEK